MPSLSSLFISHSNKDAAIAADVGRRLRAEGYTDFYLDFDPEQGTPAGRSWEREIYAQLRRVDGVIFLASPTSVESKWCFAELTIARLLTKPIFPLRPEESACLGAFDDVQWIDLFCGGDPFTRLWAGLRQAGFDPRDSFSWDPTRSPYPGLQAFAPEDAAVFFGRDGKIDELMDRLDPFTRGVSQSVNIVGPSGSGKSSLLRAGLLPRLRRLPDRWVVLAPMVPGSRPRTNLARSFAQALIENDRPPIAELKRMLGSATGLIDLVAEILDNRTGDPKLLVVIDQAEELITRTDKHEQHAFLRLLRDALKTDNRLRVVSTVRSEFLSRAPERAGLTEEAYAVVVEPISRSRLPEVIEKPARRAGIEFEPALVERMVEDTVGGDALPLLAYTLHELYSRLDGRTARVTSLDYDAIGGVSGALQRHADRIMTELQHNGCGELVLPTLMKLAAATESGEVTRRRIPLSSLNSGEKTLVQGFIDGWLLTSKKDARPEATIEVAHEALLRQWPPLRAKIDECLASLQLRSELDRLAIEWDNRGRGKDDEEPYLLRGNRLDDVLRWANDNPTELNTVTGAFLSTSKEFQRRRLTERQDAADLNLTRQLHARAVSLRHSRPDTSLLLDATALTIAPPQAKDEARFALLSNLARGVHICTQLAGHAGAVRAVAFSPDDATLVTGSSDATVRLWDPATGRLRRKLTGHTGAVYGVTFSGDGAVLASASADRSVRLWDPESGQLQRQLTGHTDEVTAVAFGPSTEHIATASKDATVRLWDWQTGQLVRELEHPREVTSLAFTADGTSLATADLDHTVRVWDAANGSCLRTLIDDTGSVSTVAFRPDGKVLCAVGAKKVRLWDTATGEPIEEKPGGSGGALYTVAFSPDGKHLAFAGSGRCVDLNEAARPTYGLGQLSAHTGSVRALAFSHDGKTVASGSEDNTARVWELEATIAGSQVLADEIGEVHALAFSPDGKILASAGCDPLVRLGPRDGATREHAGRPHRRGPCGGIQPDATLIVTAGHGNTAWLWRAASGDRQAELAGHTGEVYAASFSPDGAVVATASADRTVRLWNSASGSLVGEIVGHGDTVRSVAFAPDGRLLATGSYDGRVCLWDLATSEMVRDLVGHTDNVNGVAFSPDGKTLATAGADQTVRLWDPTTGRLRTTLTGGNAFSVYTVAFSPDGRVLATAGADNTLHLWSADTAQPFGQPMWGHRKSINAVVFSPDGQSLATAGDDGSVRLWNLRPEYLLARTSAIVKRNLSLYEWAELVGPHTTIGPFFRTFPATRRAIRSQVHFGQGRRTLDGMDVSR